jgi:hypothetical protein
MRARVRFRDVVMVALIGASLLFNAHEVSSNNHQWCSTLNLITSKPVPEPSDPSANPSREEAFTLYTDFAVLRGRFGC